MSPVLIDLGHRDRNMDLALEYDLDFTELRTAHITILDRDGEVVAQRAPVGLVGLGTGSSIEFSPKKLHDLLSRYAIRVFRRQQ